MTMEQKTNRKIFHGWLVLAVSLLSMTFAYGMQSAFPIFFVQILNEFGGTRADTAGIISVFIIMYGLSAPLVGRLMDTIGARRVLPIGVILMSAGLAASGLAQTIWHLYFTFGVVVSIGVCFLGIVAQIPMITNWFVRKRGLAYGIVLAGFGTSAFIAYLSQFLITSLGWREAYFVLAGLVIIILMPLILIFIRNKPKDMGLSPDGYIAEDINEIELQKDMATRLTVNKVWINTSWTLGRAIKTSRFWMLLFANLFVWGAGMNIIFTHQVAFMQDVGYSPFFAASIIVIFGVFNALGSLLGMISDRIGRETTYTLGTVLALAATVILIFTNNAAYPWIIYLYAVLLGIGMGMCGPPITGALADLFQGTSFGTITGVVTMGFGLGGAIFPWLAGYIFDISGSYKAAFLVAAAGIAIACLLVWVSSPRKIRLVPGKIK